MIKDMSTGPVMHLSLKIPCSTIKAGRVFFFFTIHVCETFTVRVNQRKEDNFFFFFYLYIRSFKMSLIFRYRNASCGVMWRVAFVFPLDNNNNFCSSIIIWEKLFESAHYNTIGSG